jgi:hypothetical protein
MAYNMTKAGVSKKAFLPFLDTPGQDYKTGF